MDYLELIKFKESQFENLKTNVDKSIVWGKLKALEDLSLYIDQMRESLSRLLVVNGIEDDEDFEKKVLNPKASPEPRRASP